MIVQIETLLIPIAYAETFVMVLVAFIIGYVGAMIHGNFLRKKIEKKNARNTDHLLERIQKLKDELERKSGVVYRKDRMNQEFDQLKLHKRAFSDDVLSNKLKVKKETSLIDFERIGTASNASRNDLQQINGIGPYTEVKLNGLGIYTYNQISRFTKEDIEVITELIQFFPGRIEKDQWVYKATRLLEVHSKSSNEVDVKPEPRESTKSEQKTS